MAWTARQYFDPEKGVADLAAPVIAENKETAESFDRLFSGSGRYYLWNVEDGGGGSGPVPKEEPRSVQPWADIAPERAPIYAPPTNPGPVLTTILPAQETARPIMAPPTNPGPIFGTLVAPSGRTPQAPPTNPGPVFWMPDPAPAPPVASANPPVGPRIIEWTDLGAPTTPPRGYSPIETFPIPGPTITVPTAPPVIGAKPVEWFPVGPVLFSTPIGDDGFPKAPPAPPVVELPGPVVDLRSVAKTIQDLVPLIPVEESQPPATPEPAPAPNPPTPVQSSTPAVTVKQTPTMPTARYALAGSPEPGESTTMPDTNALLKQALDTVGALANVFVPPTSTGPSPTAAPAPLKPSPWWEKVPQWAWLVAAAVVGFLALRRR